MDNDDRFYGALLGDEAVSAPRKSREMTAWWLAYTIVLTILAAMVAIILVIMCASSFILFELAGSGKRWGRRMLGGDRLSQPRMENMERESKFDLHADHHPRC